MAPRVSSTTGPEVRSLLVQSLKNRLTPNSHLDLVGPFAGIEETRTSQDFVHLQLDQKGRNAFG